MGTRLEIGESFFWFRVSCRDDNLFSDHASESSEFGKRDQSPLSNTEESADNPILDEHSPLINASTVLVS